MAGITRTATVGGAAIAVLSAALGGWWWVVGTSDRVAPEITIAYPPDGSTISGQVPVQVTATDDVGVQVVRFSVDDKATCVIVNPPYTCIWDPPETQADTPHTISATAYDAQGNRRNATIAVTSAAMLVITTESLPGATVGTPYKAEVVCVGGVPPYTWEVYSGTLPPGITFVGAGSTGVFSGTPTVDGTFQLVISVRDSPLAGTAQMAFLAFGPHTFTLDQGPVSLPPLPKPKT